MFILNFFWFICSRWSWSMDLFWTFNCMLFE